MLTRELRIIWPFNIIWKILSKKEHVLLSEQVDWTEQLNPFLWIFKLILKIKKTQYASNWITKIIFTENLQILTFFYLFSGINVVWSPWRVYYDSPVWNFLLPVLIPIYRFRLHCNPKWIEMTFKRKNKQKSTFSFKIWKQSMVMHIHEWDPEK